MKMWKKVIAGTAASAAVGLNLAVAGSTMAFANEHTNEHANQHLNDHVNEHVNQHLNVHVNEHVNQHLNVHVNEHVNQHLNVHVNEHVNHHVNVHANEYVNLHVNEHVNVPLDEYQQMLVACVHSLQCDRIDYLYSYFSQCHLTQSDLEHIQANVKRINNLCANSHGQTKLTPADRQEAWRLLESTLGVFHLHTCIVDKEGHPANILIPDSDQTVYVQLKDDEDHQLATLHLERPDAPQSYVTDVSTLGQAADVKTHIRPNTSTAAVTGTLPQTATSDPLLIALGALLVALGGIGLIPALRKIKQMQN